MDSSREARATRSTLDRRASSGEDRAGANIGQAVIQPSSSTRVYWRLSAGRPAEGSGQT